MVCSKYRHSWKSSHIAGRERYTSACAHCVCAVVIVSTHRHISPSLHILTIPNCRSWLRTINCFIWDEVFTLHTALYTLHTSHFTQQTSLFTLNTSHCYMAHCNTSITPHASHLTLHAAHFTLRTSQFTPYPSSFTLYTSTHRFRWRTSGLLML